MARRDESSGAVLHIGSAIELRDVHRTYTGDDDGITTTALARGRGSAAWGAREGRSASLASLGVAGAGVGQWPAPGGRSRRSCWPTNPPATSTPLRVKR